MSSSAALALAAVVLVTAIAALLVLARARQSARLDRLLAEAARAREASESVDRRFDEFRRSVEERVHGVERSLSEGQKGLTEHLGESGKLMKDVGEQMGRIFEASQKIEKLAGDMTRLEDLLKPPKLRGTLGEAFLEQALRQALPPGSWQMQYRFADGMCVDAAIRLRDRWVTVDSKFPLENFRRARELEDETERRRARVAFASDVRKHADTIRRKYIRPAEGTCDYAFMYVPAEAVYAEMVADGEEKALADECIQMRVFPVSPRLFYAFLSTVAMVLRGEELQKNAREVQERLSELERLWERAEEPFLKVRGHMNNAQKQYEEAAAALNRFSAKLSGITEIAQEKLETAADAEAEVIPLLPPS
ncbi:MAG TPA: DNA recombination protein RmuC [Thermoanaerobaculia bacterium]|nr:DNA recombination protein RmuC [Thermoanaerobaculia bacterium]